MLWNDEVGNRVGELLADHCNSAGPLVGVGHTAQTVCLEMLGLRLACNLQCLLNLLF